MSVQTTFLAHQALISQPPPPRPGGFNPHYATGYAVDLLWYGALF